MRFYLDTSALVKSLLAERDTDLVVDAIETADALGTCRVAYPETRAALAAAQRTRRIDAGTWSSVRAVLDQELWPRLGVVEVTAALATSAGDLAELHGLRGFDAVHLAAAGVMAGDDLVVMTWDERLWRAARDQGMQVLPPQPPGA